MKWDEFIDNNDANIPDSGLHSVRTDIECPICGRLVHMTYPDLAVGKVVMWNYFCVCGWEGKTTSGWKSDDEDDEDDWDDDDCWAYLYDDEDGENE